MTNTETASASLPALDNEYPLSPAQVEDYRRDGHVLLRGVASPEEAAAYRPVIRNAALSLNTETRALEDRDAYGKAFLQTMNLWRRDEGVRRFTLARRFAGIAARLMGVPAVRIYHDQALFKEPGGGPTPWHQDQYYWPLDTNQTVTMWMPLVPVPPEIGSMTFGSGSQRLGFLGQFFISEESDRVFEKMIADKNIRRHSYGAMAPGDATWHSGWTLHSAAGNPTAAMREVMTIIYFADGARISEPDNPSRQDDLDQWLPGLRPGDAAASPLNPLVFP
jgi:ectoine hydroxylase-related dioxygenase (phytanoyl-CoA dioxygenase family)